MEATAGIYYFGRLGLLLILVILSIALTIRLMRARPFSMGRGLAVTAVGAIALAGLWVITGATPGIAWVAALLAVGVILGILTGRAARPATGDPSKLRPSPLTGIVTGLASIFASITLLFGTSYLFSLSLLGIALAVGCQLGQTLGGSAVVEVAPRAGATGQIT
ncbi:MAG: hypothetical protein KKA32_17840 [Actinobacteria bacterium]|nr:hypothetical protein [Actinomycetota bacterium]